MSNKDGSSLVAQQVKDLALLQLWHRLHLWHEWVWSLAQELPHVASVAKNNKLLVKNKKICNKDITFSMLPTID